MTKSAILICGLLLAGCQAAPSQPTQETQETVSPTDYQACIQAAMSGNGADSDEKCQRVLQNTR
ncbi:ChiQ/YbfN family lipoprotein [Scandinavium manionii]|uniref:ChiQ/YbfN family lipoprotein n=1 Tax=Scandinavium manionii TaxID=2926520 RepID=UPI0021660C9B|nr:ChiQ/YbfN family lipoprotein [Scandinavium manionii]MCS2149612.1 ChiQ/YbfN family lipoprotein [Scandinavium manionii]